MYKNDVANKNIGVVWSQEWMGYDVYLCGSGEKRTIKKKSTKRKYTIISDDNYENNDFNIGNIKADNKKAVFFLFWKMWWLCSKI